MRHQQDLALEQSRVDERKLTTVNEQRLLTELVALQRIGQKLNSTLDLGQILEAVLEEAVGATPATHASIHFIDQSTGQLHLRTWRGYSPEQMADIENTEARTVRGIIHQVIETGLAVSLSDVNQDPDYYSLVPETRSVLAVPICYAGEIVGVINLESPELAAFSPDNIRFLEILADQAAIAIGNTRRYEDQVRQGEALSRRVEQLATLFEISGALRMDLSLGEILERIIYAIPDTVGFNKAILSWVEGDPPYLKRVVSAGIPLAVFRQLQRVCQPLAKLEAVMRDEYRISNSFFIPHHRQEDWGKDLAIYTPLEGEEEWYEGKWHPNDMLLVPLRSADGPILGLLSVDDPQDGLVPTQRAIETLELFANQASVAIENARLFDERDRRISELGTLTIIGRIISSVMELDELMDKIYQQVSLVMDTTNFYIALHDEEKNEVNFEIEVKRGNRLLKRRQEAGIGLTGHIIRTRQPVLIKENVQLLKEIEPSGELARSWLGVPMIAAGRVVGVMAVYSYVEEGAFDEEHLDLLFTIANQAAIAIENARLYQEIQRRLEELTFLNRVGRTVASSLDLGQILTMVMEEATLMLGVEVASILLLDEESAELVFEAAVGPRSEGMKGLRMSLGQGIAGWATQEGQPLLVPNVEEDPRFYPGIDEATGFVTRSVLAVPLEVKGKVIGVIEALNKAEGEFSQADVTLLSSMAQTAAIAIENAQLFAETQRGLEEMAALYDVSLDITARLEMPELLKSIVERAVILLGADAGSIYLYDSEREELSMVIGYDYTEKYMGITLKPGEGMAGKVFQSGEPLIVDDYRIWEGRAVAFEADQPFTAVLGVPLKWQERVIGVLVIAADVEKRTFNQGDVWLATLFANQAAVAIENAHLYEELKQEHERLQRAQEQMLAAERWAVLGKAAANLAHRINNTAGLIPVAIQDLKELLADVALEEERRQEVDADLQRVERNTRFTLQMADALFKPFEDLPAEECDVNALLEESISVTNVPEDVTLAIEYADGLPGVIASRRLADVFVELITNAVQAMPDGGELEIGSRLGREGGVEVWFSDTGHGIPPESQGKIFDLFFTTSKDSLGFGLWWVKTFLEQYGATIDVESEVGKGTTFTVRLPVEGPQAAVG